VQEAVGTGNHKTAPVMVKAADTLWDACCGHDPTVAAATTHCIRSPAPPGGRGAAAPALKVAPPTNHYFYSFQNPGSGM
jgi:hypothetical protein